MATRTTARMGNVAFWAVMVVGFLGAAVAVAQEEPPPPPPEDDPVSRIADRLKERGIELSPDQIDRARRIMEDVRDGRAADPNDVRSIFGSLRKQFEARMQKRLQEQLGASDDEWKILEPKIKRVRDLARLVESGTGQMMMGGPGGPMGQGGPGGPGGQAGPGGPGGMMGRGPGGFGMFRNADANSPEQADLEKKTSALQKAVGSQQSTPEDVAAALKAYRDARTKIKGDLEKARQELRELLTVRQEAQLVAMSVLE